MPILVATRGPKHGKCNICGESGVLTEDHTPPKGCIRPTQVELRHVIEVLSATPSKEKARLSQNGVKYRTLCGRCNNSLLGHLYDPAMIELVNKVATILRSPILLPNPLAVSCQPQALIRSVIGHIAAQGVDRYRKGLHTEAIRDYLLDHSLPLPEGLKIFYWLYPWRVQILVRDAVYMDLHKDKQFLFWIMKFFPMAFMVVFDEIPDFSFQVQNLDPCRQLPFTTRVDLPILLHPIPPLEWPEAPTEASTLLYGREAITAKEGKAKPKSY